MGDPSVYDDNMGPGYDPSQAPDTFPAGAGGDPYSDSPPDTTSPETMDLGTMPGGTDAQLTPFSPNQGFDFTDILGGVARGLGLAPQARPAWYARAGSAGVGSGVDPYAGGGGGFGIQGAPRLPTSIPFRDTGPGGPTPAQQVGLIVRDIRQRTHMRVSARSLVNLVVHYGFDATAQLTGADKAALLLIFMRQKGVTHHRRGPGLYTIAKRLRKADRLRGTIRHMLGKHVGSGGGGRRRYAFQKRKRRS